jgi:hypothetical protein
MGKKSNYIIINNNNTHIYTSYQHYPSSLNGLWGSALGFDLCGEALRVELLFRMPLSQPLNLG